MADLAFLILALLAAIGIFATYHTCRQTGRSGGASDARASGYGTGDNPQRRLRGYLGVPCRRRRERPETSVIPARISTSPPIIAGVISSPKRVAP